MSEKERSIILNKPIASPHPPSNQKIVIFKKSDFYGQLGHRTLGYLLFRSSHFFVIFKRVIALSIAQLLF